MPSVAVSVHGFSEQVRDADPSTASMRWEVTGDPLNAPFRHPTVTEALPSLTATTASGGDGRPTTCTSDHGVGGPAVGGLVELVGDDVPDHDVAGEVRRRACR